MKTLADPLVQSATDPRSATPLPKTIALARRHLACTEGQFESFDRSRAPDGVCGDLPIGNRIIFERFRAPSIPRVHAPGVIERSERCTGSRAPTPRVCSKRFLGSSAIPIWQAEKRDAAWRHIRALT